jgi:hypothetical protein
MQDENNIIYRLRKRAEIRRGITTRKSVQENRPDRISDLLEEAAQYIEDLENQLQEADCEVQRLEKTLLNHRVYL